ncbi:hypothetical protein SYJ56_03395 [Algoriphagus sp. D3-2-R+10]|uniref:RNA polymerase sigma factor n=1 Tax=Algoriphagus aurantiacus TaxID=3103948 RepID=UPI002B365F11|nr:hypothetical protein [Algoriphagus sp. D3-2-R+10]MEB2774333.1 hypothetical protein [Algoriphagus sp. D3-2-R+10]
MKENLKSKSGRGRFFLQMYRESFPDLASFVSRRGGSLEDAQDIFQDSLIIYYEQLVTGLEVRRDGGYLFGIARHLWYRRFRDPFYKMEKSSTEELEEVVEFEMSADQEKSQVWVFLKSAGQKCMDLLKSFYYDQLSMDELAVKFGYRTTRSATVQKYKCLEKVRDQVKRKSLTYEDFS